jgi:signal transduction histidine kinase
LRRYELESLLKSFFIFFLLLGAIYILFALGNYHDRQRELDERILSEMRIFSFRPTGNAFQVDFSPKIPENKVLHLYRDPERLYAFFTIPGSEKYLLKISLPIEEYQKRLERIRRESFAGWVLYLILIAVISFLLALYTLHPLKKALELNEEFVKDILHDLNTPLSAIRINLNLLKKRLGSDRVVERMFNSLETVQTFQSNLRAFLDRECGRKERFDLKELLARRIEYFRQIHPGIRYHLEIDKPLWVECNREAMLRILENLLSNAGRYNVPGGKVWVRLEGTRLVIADTGVGIKHPERVFERFYKEGERGLGLGLHIVKKLADNLGISIALHSAPGKGTEVILELSEVISK